VPTAIFTRPAGIGCWAAAGLDATRTASATAHRRFIMAQLAEDTSFIGHSVLLQIREWTRMQLLIRQ
jgi:hypothetical protein